MIGAGYIRECLQVYTGIRKLAIESDFHHLKVENLSIGEVQRLKWDVVEEKIKGWIRAANICVRILLASEKKLCEQIFEGFDEFEGMDCDADEACFYETVKGFAVQVLNFAEAVSIGDRLPHKLFKMLDLYDSFSKLLPDIAEVFDSKLSEGILVHANEIHARLVVAARGMLTEFEKCVIEEPSQVPVPGGTVHPFARYSLHLTDFKRGKVGIVVEKFSEATVGYREDKEVAERWVKLFRTPYFQVSAVLSMAWKWGITHRYEVIQWEFQCCAPELAVASFFFLSCLTCIKCEAAIMRIGLREMKAFSKLMFPSVKDSTFFEMWDSRCHHYMLSFNELEAELLQGQKLQGVSTAREVYEVLCQRGWQELFPFSYGLREDAE